MNITHSAIRLDRKKSSFFTYSSLSYKENHFKTHFVVDFFLLILNFNVDDPKTWRTCLYFSNKICCSQAHVGKT